MDFIPFFSIFDALLFIIVYKGVFMVEFGVDKVYTGGITNDIDGGIPFQPEFYHEENGQEYMIELLPPNILKSYVASKDFKSSTPKFPEKKVRLEELANSMEDTDNPIIVMVKLK